MTYVVSIKILHLPPITVMIDITFEDIIKVNI